MLMQYPIFYVLYQILGAAKNAKPKNGDLNA